jgi:hypothetical protein
MPEPSKFSIEIGHQCTQSSVKKTWRAGFGLLLPFMQAVSDFA